jgi:2-haloacid dehalogenase
VDALHRMKLDELLPKYGVTGLSEAEVADFNRVWHRLEPWPDSVPGLTRLKTKFIISPLSNGGFGLLTNMAKRAGLPWDCIISSELARAFKPDPRAYQTAAELLGLPLDGVMLVAAHVNDLRAAQRTGLHAAYVPRPFEFDPNGRATDPADPAFDYVAKDFVDLAEQLGA